MMEQFMWSECERVLKETAGRGSWLHPSKQFDRPTVTVANWLRNPGAAIVGTGLDNKILWGNPPELLWALPAYGSGKPLQRQYAESILVNGSLRSHKLQIFFVAPPPPCKVCHAMWNSITGRNVQVTRTRKKHNALPEIEHAQCVTKIEPRPLCSYTRWLLRKPNALRRNWPL